MQPRYTTIFRHTETIGFQEEVMWRSWFDCEWHMLVTGCYEADKMGAAKVSRAFLSAMMTWRGTFP